MHLSRWSSKEWTMENLEIKNGGPLNFSSTSILQSISHAATAFFVGFEDSFIHETLDFTEGGVVACVEEGGGFFGGKRLGEAACHDLVDELLFAGAERVVCVGAAELDAADFRGEKFFAILDGVPHHLQEP